MPNPLIAAFVEGLRQTMPFHSLPASNRLTETLWTAHNDTLLRLRLPLYYDRLRKPRPKQKTYDAAIQSGLAVLGSFALLTGTAQAIIRIDRSTAQAISFQPRPFGANWIVKHGITPAAMQVSWTDPLLERDPMEVPRLLTLDVSTRDILHLAGKVALAVVNSTTTDPRSNGVATFTFARTGTQPKARVVYRPLALNAPSHTVVLAGTSA
jgi:hypothetical protein